MLTDMSNFTPNLVNKWTKACFRSLQQDTKTKFHIDYKSCNLSTRTDVTRWDYRLTATTIKKKHC